MSGYRQGDHRSNVSPPPSPEKTKFGAWIIYPPKRKPIAVRAPTAFKAKEMASIVLKVDTRQFECEFLEAQELAKGGFSVVVTSENFRIFSRYLTKSQEPLE